VLVNPAPGVGLEPTTYGLTVPEKPSRAVHVRPPRTRSRGRMSSSVRTHPGTFIRLAVKLAVRSYGETSPADEVIQAAGRVRLAVVLGRD
jgi:hypothetical protein